MEKMPTPEEIAKMQKSRAISDADLLKGGAEYEAAESENLRLNATDKQAESARKEMESDKTEKNFKELYKEKRLKELFTDLKALSESARNVHEYSEDLKIRQAVMGHELSRIGNDLWRVGEEDLSDIANEASRKALEGGKLIETIGVLGDAFEKRLKS